MEAKYTWLNSLLNRNKTEFAKWPEIKWANFYLAGSYQEQRDKLLQEMKNSLLYKDTKPFLNHISKGCEICGSGKWSCLFITNKCNAGCFYCPAPQEKDELPSTQGLNFSSADNFADYINHFLFQGVSFSGGEPLLYFERTMDYLRTIRKRCANDLYVWMYTNGILADANKLTKLADENLNEIRFDIGATGFNLDNVKKAKGIIPNITIEIPSVPEEKDRIISLLPDMINAGVSNLNLHHLRMTQHNVSKLIKRGYTIINAERPLVLESELAALEILSTAGKMGLDIGINYCSFHYKNRFQKAGYRKIIAECLIPDAVVTENGYLREYGNNTLCYKTVKLYNDASKYSDEEKIIIEGEVYAYRIHKVFYESSLSPRYQQSIDNLLEHEPETPPSDPLLFKIWQFEYIERGLREE